MQPLTSEWIEKAEEDFISAQREYRARNRPNYNAACFFSQQCIEKYIKARLQEAEIEIIKTHDLVKLLDLVEPVEPLWQAYRPTFRIITAYAVEYRYTGRGHELRFPFKRKAAKPQRFKGFPFASLRPGVKNFIRQKRNLYPCSVYQLSKG